MPAKRMTSAQRRAQIIEVAIDLIGRNGFERTTTKAIAEACGVDESLIFHYFKSKEDIYTATFSYLYDRMVESFNRISQGVTNAAQSIRDLHLSRIDYIYANPDTAAGAVREASCEYSNETQRKYNLDSVYLTMDFLEGLVERAQREGDIRKDISPAMAACMIQSSIFFNLMAGVCGLQEKITREQARANFETLMDTLKPC